MWVSLENACQSGGELVFQPTIRRHLSLPSRKGKLPSVAGLTTPVNTTAWTGGFLFPRRMEIYAL
jgi:hypothetical protein